MWRAAAVLPLFLTPKRTKSEPVEQQPTNRVSWHHAPLHLFEPNCNYMLTAATLHKEHHFRGADRLRYLESLLLEVYSEKGWEIRAWAVFSNHYHLIVRSPQDACGLSSVVQRIHSQSSRWVNQLDGAPGRQVWFQYRDKCLTFEKSYFARLNYVTQNAVKHGLVERAVDYPFCSASYYEQNYSSAILRRLSSYKHDRVEEQDEYAPQYDQTE